MDYNGPKTEKHLIKFVSSVNAKGPMLIEDLDDINKLVNNSTDNFFVSFAFKVWYTIDTLRNIVFTIFLEIWEAP